MKKVLIIFSMLWITLSVMGQSITASEIIDITNGKITLSDLSQALTRRGFKKDFMNNEVVLYSDDCNITLTPIDNGRYRPLITAYDKDTMGKIVKQFKSLGFVCTDKIEENLRNGDLAEWMYSKKGYPNLHVYTGPRGYFCLEWAALGSKLQR